MTPSSASVRLVPTTAVLLPTYNGSRFVASQIQSLADNETPFALHWLDDHSTDDTRELVRSAAQTCKIGLTEWHQQEHLGWPRTFFKLMELVSADIYLFCDQDDLWQRGRIDSAVAALSPEIDTPMLCFSQALMFEEEAPESLVPVYEAMGTSMESALAKSRLFVFNPCQGNTAAFTRPLRDVVIRHKDITRDYGVAHDWWLYLIATASGKTRLLSDAPCVLYRVHSSNTVGVNWLKGDPMDFALKWRMLREWRRWVALQAQAFCAASKTLPPGPKLEYLLKLARDVACLERRQSLGAVLRLAQSGVMPPSRRLAAWFAFSCLCTDAVP
jgi:rhamnosyltransferase